jgi:hypothetical protein
MPPTLTYTCPCGQRHTHRGPLPLRRRWGTLDYTPWWQHRCPACGRVNTVHEGEAVMSTPRRSYALLPRDPDLHDHLRGQ